MPLIIFLVECGLELIPKQIRNHPSVRNNLSSQNYSSQLLDNALHHSAMETLTNHEKRGRPDIAHICLLNALGSSLNKSDFLKIFVHTTHDKIFEFNPEVRIARNFNRFKGLSAKLLIDGNIQVNGSYLIKQRERNIIDVINSFQTPEIVLFSSKGKLIKNHQDLFYKDITRNYIAIIGGFQKGFFSEEISTLSDNLVSISKFNLDAWVVVNKVISFYEITHDIL